MGLSIGTDARTEKVEGDTAHDAVDSGNPIKIGGKARDNISTALPNDDRVNAWFDRYGALVVKSANSGNAAGQIVQQASFDAATTPAQEIEFFTPAVLIKGAGREPNNSTLSAYKVHFDCVEPFNFSASSVQSIVKDYGTYQFTDISYVSISGINLSQDDAFRIRCYYWSDEDTAYVLFASVVLAQQPNPGIDPSANSVNVFMNFDKPISAKWNAGDARFGYVEVTNLLGGHDTCDIDVIIGHYEFLTS